VIESEVEVEAENETQTEIESGLGSTGREAIGSAIVC
jgi:hypothetical protein